jgi:cytochrome c-type biogenesis protein CcmH/NrfF
MIKIFAILTAILAATLSSPTKAEAHTLWVAPALIGGLGAMILSLRQTTKHSKQKRVRHALRSH